MGYQWDESQYQSLPSKVQQARDCLDYWFKAMETNTDYLLVPDIFFMPAITQEKADAIVEYLDSEYEKELSWAKQIGFEAPPGFTRLKPQQRIRLAQDLYLILHKEPKPIDSEIHHAGDFG